MKYSHKIILILAVFIATAGLQVSNAAVRTWVGAGAGGGGTDFNNGANWSPAGALLATDDYVMTLSSNAIVTLSANITIRNFTFTVIGGTTGRLNVVNSVLTMNGPFVCDAVHSISPVSYSYLQLYVGTAAAGFVFNSTATFHTTGAGITYIYGPSLNPGFLKFYNNVTWGPRVRTAAGVEPDMYYDAPVAQTVTINILTTTTFVMPEDVWYGFANSPVITFAGTSAGTQRMYYGSYDGNLRIKNTTVLKPMYSTLDGFAGVLDFFMDPGSKIEINYDNDFPQGGFNNYFLDITSTVEYLGVASAQTVTGTNVAGLTYGNLIIGGTGNKSAGFNNSVHGDFTIRGASTYLASIYSHNLWGHFTNNGTYTCGTSTWRLDGTANQNIQGVVSTTFHNLTVNKASGTAYLMINTNVGSSAAAGVMNYQAGPLDLNSFQLSIMNNNTTAVVRTAGYAISETNAALNPSTIRWLTGTVTGNFLYPFGVVGGTYIPLTINKTNAVNANITAATRTTLASDNLPWANTVTHMYDPNLAGNGAVPAVVDRWWEIQSNAAVTANITFSYRGAENTLSAPYQTGNIGAQYWSAAWLLNNANYGSAPAVTAGVGSVTANGVPIGAAYTPWVLSSLSAPLPIELTDLSVVCTNDDAVMNWTTASELDNNYFTVERSDDGMNFIEVGRVDGAGTSSQLHHYEFIDHSAPAFGNSYYRLRQTDYNGTSTVSHVVLYSSCNTTGTAFNVFSTDGSSLNLSLTNESASSYVIQILDASGRLILEKQIIAEEGQNSYIIPEVFVSNGIYFVNLVSGTGEVNTRKIFLSK